MPSTPVSTKSLLKPARLKPGDTIAVISPAAATPQPQAAFEQGQRVLEQAGYRVKRMPHAGDQACYLAGTDADRLSDLHAAFVDPEVNAILCARGGYGAMRLLPGLDLDLIRAHPKIFVGFSDITVLLNTFYQHAGLLGFYGPMLTSNLIFENEAASGEELFRLLAGEWAPPYTIPNQDPYTCFQPGVAEGPLVGGNLSLLAATCGTPWQVNTDGAIFFIEDWKEQYYSLDRQFQQLRLAGLFKNIAGLLLCDFSEVQPEPDFDLVELLRRLSADLHVPSGYGFSVGHGAFTATLPLGARARFDAESGSLVLLESPFSKG